VLAETVGALAERLDSQYLHRGGNVEQVLAAFAADHAHARGDAP
jgi:hypothetical protein